MNRKCIVYAAVMAACLLWSALPAMAQELDGARVYNDNCARCHAPRAAWEFSDSAWEIIVHHMHVRGYLTEQERKAVLAYLQKNNLRVAFKPATPPDGTTRDMDGEALVAKLGCQGCHIVGGKGGAIGPSLDTLFERRDVDYLLKKLSDPRFDNSRSVMPYFNLTEDQKRKIAEHLKTVAVK